MAIVFILAGLVLVIVNLINFQDFREEARKNHDSAWPENFVNVSYSGFGLMLVLIGCALWAKVDLRIEGVPSIITMIVGALSLLAFGIFLFNEKLMPKLSKKLERRRVKKEMEEKAWQDYLARSTPVIAPQAPAPVSAPQQIAPAQPMQAQSVQPVSQQFAPATAAAMQAQAQPASPTPVLQVQPTPPAKLAGGVDAQSVLDCYLKEHELSRAFERMPLGPEKAKTGQALYAQKTQCYGKELIFNGLSPEDRDWVTVQYNLGIAKIDAANAAALAPAQARVIPVTKAGAANDTQDQFVEPETVQRFLRTPDKAAAPGTKPAPKQPTKGPTAAKKTTPPTARK